MGLPNPSHETKFSGANGDGKILFLSAQLTTSRIGNLTWLILTLAICDDHTYIWPTTTCITAAPFTGTTLEVYWLCAGGLLPVNVIGTHLRDPINPGLTQWCMAV